MIGKFARTEFISYIETSRFLVSVDMEISDWKIILSSKVPELQHKFDTPPRAL